MTAELSATSRLASTTEFNMCEHVANTPLYLTRGKHRCFQIFNLTSCEKVGPLVHASTSHLGCWRNYNADQHKFWWHFERYRQNACSLLVAGRLVLALLDNAVASDKHACTFRCTLGSMYVRQPTQMCGTYVLRIWHSKSIVLQAHVQRQCFTRQKSHMY
jgi:hypothetical protein